MIATSWLVETSHRQRAEPKTLVEHSHLSRLPRAFTVAQLRYRVHGVPLRKHTYSNILKILPPKMNIIQMKKFDIFHISAQNIDCGYSLEPPR